MLCLWGKEDWLTQGHLVFWAVYFLCWYVNFTLGLEQNGSLINIYTHSQRTGGNTLNYNNKKLSF